MVESTNKHSCVFLHTWLTGTRVDDKNLVYLKARCVTLHSLTSMHPSRSGEVNMNHDSGSAHRTRLGWLGFA